MITPEIKSKMIIRALIGFILGMFISMAFCIHNADGFDLRFVINLLAGGVIGFINNGSSAVYDIESWGTTKATVIHYISTVIVFLTIALSLGWFSIDMTLLIFMIIFTVVYVIIWLSEYLYFKKTVNEINKELESFKKTEKG